MNRSLKIVYCIFLLTGPVVAKAQLLKGAIVCDTIRYVSVELSLEGDYATTTNSKVAVDSKGNFVFDKDLATPFNDVVVRVNGQAFGVHVEQQKTATIALTPNADGKFEAVFGGNQKDVSRFYNKFNELFNYSTLMMGDFSTPASVKKQYDLLEGSYHTLVALLPSIGDEKMRHYYQKLTDASYTYYQLKYITERSRAEEKGDTTFTSYKSLVSSIDINDDASIRSRLYTYYYSEKMSKEAQDAFGEDMDKYCTDYLRVIGQYITNPLLRRVMLRNCAYNYISFNPNPGTKAFWDTFNNFTGNDPVLIAKYQVTPEEVEKRKANGMKPVDLAWHDVNGKVQALSGMSGKYLYIQFWASWTYSSASDFEHLARLAKEYKNCKDLELVSVNLDNSHYIWKELLSKYKASWKQYAMDEDNASIFRFQWGVTGLPMAVIVDKKGNIVQYDAPAPSDPKLRQVINQLLKKK